MWDVFRALPKSPDITVVNGRNSIKWLMPQTAQPDSLGLCGQATLDAFLTHATALLIACLRAQAGTR